MSKSIEIHNNKSLRLENVLIYKMMSISSLSETGEDKEEPLSLELEVSRMENEIKTKGAKPVGPLIQFSGAEVTDEEINFNICFMMQADRFINNINPRYTMKPTIEVKNCMYTRFIGKEEDIDFAYKKIEVEAYENEVKLTGNSYTVFLDSDDLGNITADIFMETER